MKLLDHRSFKRFIRSIGEKVIFQGGAEYDQTRRKNYDQWTKLIKEISKK